MARYQKTNTEGQILAAAEEVFLQSGFAGARTTDIAAKAGVTHAMLHYYFKTKEELFHTVLRMKVESFIEAAMMPLDNEELPIIETVEQEMRMHYGFLKANPSLPSFVLSSIQQDRDTVKDILKEVIVKARQYIASVQKRLDKAAEAGEIRPVRAHILLSDIAMLNLSSIMCMHAFDLVKEMLPPSRLDFLDQKLEENIKLIKQSLIISCFSSFSRGQ